MTIANNIGIIGGAPETLDSMLEVYLTTSRNFPITSATVFNVVYDTIEKSSNYVSYNTSSGVFTCSAAGKFLIEGQALLNVAGGLNPSISIIFQCHSLVVFPAFTNFQQSYYVLNPGNFSYRARQIVECASGTTFIFRLVTSGVYSGGAFGWQGGLNIGSRTTVTYLGP